MRTLYAQIDNYIHHSYIILTYNDEGYQLFLHSSMKSTKGNTDSWVWSIHIRNISRGLPYLLVIRTYILCRVNNKHIVGNLVNYTDLVLDTNSNSTDGNYITCVIRSLNN